MTKFIEFLKDESGATAIEYGLIAALMTTAIIAGITNFGNETESMYNTITDAVIQ